MQASTTPLPQLLDVFAVAEQTGLTTHRIWQLVRSGNLPCVHLGRSVRFDPEALAEWIRAGGSRA